MPIAAEVFFIWLASSTIAGLSLGLLFRSVAKGGAAPVRQMPRTSEKRSLRRSA